MTKRELFNQFAAHSLTLLDKEHPSPVILVPSKIVSALGYEPTKQKILLCQRTLSWLQDNDYMKCGPPTWSGNPEIAETAFVGSRLTTRGFAALDIRVDFRGKLERAGDILAEQASNAASSARDATIADIVGKIVAAGAKALLG
jgi:hypothetical protein